MATVDVLTGSTPFLLDGQSVTIGRRREGLPGNELAGEYLARRLAAYGLDVTEQPFWTTGRNLVAYQRPPLDIAASEGIYMICAHYDANYSTPGADDNASGTAAVVEAARILSRLEIPHTIAYAVWDAEESGMDGSEFWADQASASGMDLRAVLNLDMISWDSDGDFGYMTTEPWPGLTTMLTATNDGLGLGLKNLGVRTIGSDHLSFTRRGFRSTSITEPTTDFNRYYHGEGDTPQNMNRAFYVRTAMLAVAILAQLGFDAAIGTEVETRIDVPSTEPAIELWPEPAADVVTMRYSLDIAGAPTIRMFDVLGREVERRTPGYLAAGTHVERIETTTRAPGVYLIRLQAGSTDVSRLLTVRR